MRRSVEKVDVEPDVWSVAVVVAGLLVAAGVTAVFRAAPATLTRIAIGILLALALDPVVRVVQRRSGWPRLVAASAVALTLVAFFAAVMAILGPPAIREAGRFTSELPATVEEFYSWPVIGSRLEEADASGRVSEWIDQLPSRLDDETVEAAAERILGGVGSLFMVMVVAVAVLIDGEAIVARARRLVPLERRERGDHAGRIVYDSIGRYFAGSLLVAAMNGTVVLATGLALGVPLAPLAGIWSALTNLIPQIGGFLGGSFFVVLALSEGPLEGAIAAAVFLVYQQFENNAIQPAIVGRAVDLSPPTTMLAALIGGAAAGVPGALIATPAVGATKALYFAFRSGATPEDAVPERPSGFRHVRDRIRRVFRRDRHGAP